MKHPQPLVTVVVVTINNLDLLTTCLNSLYRQDYEALEIIVVDNGSEEDVQGIVSKKFPEVRIVRLGENKGFAGGNNRGIEMARGKYVALINNDAVASPQWVSAMVGTAESNPRVGAVASIIIDGNRPNVLDSCGVGIALDGMSRQVMREGPVPTLRKPEKVLLFSGCACLLRMEALSEVGHFDEDFFAYCEDTDLGLRLIQAGWKICVAPGAYVRHFYSLTGGKFSLQKVYWVERNHFWVAVKNFPFFLLACLPFVTVYRYLLQAHSVLNGVGDLNTFKEKNDFASILFVHARAYRDMLKKLPAMLAKRQRPCHRRGLTHRGMAHLIWQFHLPMPEIIGMKKR